MTADVAELFERYAERYMASDADAVADMCGAPFLAVRKGVPIPLPDRPAVVAHLAGVMAAYRASGAVAADIEGVDILEQGDSAALATVHWRVRAADGSVVRDFRTSYQLVGPDPWRIFAYVNHDTVR
ncbi:DUF4440 domain-containing protein [uncultured Arthrobacter sp.]|uniref:DUF4440 domain-containing protein n=1 Tax=uncultured Arthrobacter sp. TaxID=114050 RepID=UPI0032171A07